MSALPRREELNDSMVVPFSYSPHDDFSGVEADEPLTVQPGIGDAIEGDAVPAGTPLEPGAVWDSWDWWYVGKPEVARDPNVPAHRHGWRPSRRAEVSFCRCGTVRVGAFYHLVWRGV